MQQNFVGRISTEIGNAVFLEIVQNWAKKFHEATFFEIPSTQKTCSNKLSKNSQGKNHSHVSELNSNSAMSGPLPRNTLHLWRKVRSCKFCFCGLGSDEKPLNCYVEKSFSLTNQKSQQLHPWLRQLIIEWKKLTKDIEKNVRRYV